MNKIGSRQIIEILNTKINENESIESQLKNLFTIWRGDIVLRSSWRGRISTFVTHPTEVKATHDKVCSIVAKALIEAPVESVKYTPETLKFLTWVQKKELYHPDEAVAAAFEAAKEIRELGEAAAKAKVDSFKIQEGSLLFEPLSPDHIVLSLVDQKRFFELSQSGELTEEDLNFIETYLNQHPEVAAEGWRGRLAKMRAQIVRGEELTEEFAGASETARPALLKREAELLREQVLNLTAESGQTVVHLQKYGSRCSATQKLGTILSNLPESILKEFPEKLRELIISRTKPTPREMAEALVNIFAEGESQQQVEEQGEPSFLLPNDERELTGTFARFLPDIFEDYATQAVRDGVIVAGVGLSGYKEVQLMLRWLLQNGQALSSNDTNTAFREMVTRGIEQILINFEQPVLNRADSVLKNAFSKIGNSLPGMLFELSGTEGLFLNGEIWFEFQRQADGNFSLSLYTTGHGVNFHPNAKQKDQKKFCLKLDNIEPGKLNAQFFEVLMRRNWESAWNPEFASEAHTIYDTLLPLLGGTYSKSNDRLQNISVHPSEAHNAFTTASHLLMKREGIDRDFVFDRMWEHLLDYCKKNCVKEDSLSLTETDIVHLEPILKTLMNRLGNLKENASYKDEIPQIELVLADLHRVILVGHRVDTGKAVSEFDGLENTVKSALSNLGLSFERLEQLESLLEWFLGPEVEKFMSPMIAEAKKLLPEKTAQVQKKPAKSNFKGSYATIYLNLAWQVAKMTMLAAGFYAGGVWSLLSIPTLLAVLPYILPKEHYQYYCDTMSAVRYSIAKMVFEFCWNHLFSEETKESFKQLQALPLLHMQRIDQPKETIPEPAVIPEVIVPVVQPVPVVNVRQFLTAENLEDWVKRAEEDDFDFKSFCESLLNEHLELSQFEWRKHRNPEGAYALIHRLQNLINKSNSETSLDYLLLFSAECYLSILKCNVSEANSRFQVLDNFVPDSHKNAMYEQRKKIIELGDEERFFETNLEEISYRLNACYQALLAEKIFPSYIRSNRGVITPKRCEETRLSVRKTPQLTPENLLNWSDQVSHEDNWELIVDAIRGLPLPSESDRWNHLQDTESTMKAISDISRLLLQKKDTCHRKEDKIDVILAHYRLIALGQAICRMPSDSGVISVKHPLQEGSEIDCTLLLELIYSWHFNSFNPRVHDEIEVILGQLMPEFDLAHPPTSYQEILDLNQNKLWPSEAFCLLEAEYSERLNAEIHENGIVRFDFSKPVRFLKRMVSDASVEIMRFQDSVGYKNKHGRNLLEDRIQTINTTDPKFKLSVSQPTEMVQDLINLYTTQPELFDRNVFLERLSVPGILNKAIKQNPALVDAIVEMIQKLRATKEASRTVFTLFDTFKLLEFAQQMEQFCCYCYPESKDKFQFIDEFALAIKEKKYQDRNNMIDLLKIAMDRMPADPSTVLDRSVRIDCLSKLLCNAVFIDDKEFNLSCWDLWRHELVNLFQGDDEELKLDVLRAFYRENGLSDQDIEKAIEDYEFVYDEDEEKLEIYGSGCKQFRADIAPKFGGFEQLKSLIGDSEFRSLRLVDRFTLASQNGRCVYRFLPLDVPSGDDSFLYQIQMEIKRADGQTDIYRPYKLNKQAIKPGAVPTLQRVFNPSYMCWMELFEGEGNEPKIDRARKFRICVVDSNTVLHQHGTIGEIEKRLYEDPQPVATVTATVPTSVSTKRVELTAEQSKQYPGYSVAPQQYHQAIAGMPQTILLKSDEGKYKALVPAKNTFLTMFGALTRFDVVSGPLVKKMMEKIGRYFDNDETKNYYAFDIVTDEQGVHKLVSADENKGLAYLMIYHLYRFDFKAAEEVCQEIVRLYSQGPIPADYWPEIKYLLIPFMSPQMAQYRWRVISAQQMNQTLHPVGGAKPSDSKLFPLLMNGLILSDLLSFVDNPEARNCLSPLQEYHLYRYLINHLVEFLRENLPESERLQAFVNAEFIETLFECPPFDQAAFTKRYAQLKYELGVFDENTNMKMFKWAYRFTMTPANLYEYKGEETAYQPQTTMKSNPIIKGIQALRKIKSISKSKAIGLDTQKLLEEIQPRNYNYLDIDVNSFSIDVVKKNFILYYELLHGDIEIPRGAPPDTKQRLLNVLLLNKGCGDVATQRLTEILLHVANAPGVFPPAIELIRTQCRALQGVENGLENWKELIGHLWELVILQEICHNALVPAMEKMAVSMTVGNVVASYAAPFYGNSRFVNMTVNKVRENVSETLNEWIGRYVEQITNLMTGKLSVVSPATLMVGASAATGLVFMGNMVYMAANTVLGLTGTQQVTPEVVEEEPSGIYSWMKSLAPLIPVGLMAGNAAFAYWSKKTVTVSDVLPSLPANIVTLCAKAKNLWLETRREQREKFRLTAAQRTVRVDLSLESLKDQEDDINAFLKEMFDLAYSEDSSPLQNPAEAVRLTPVNPDDPFEVERVQRVNDSIDTFYRERGERKVIYRLKDDRDFGRMAVQLQMFHYSLEKTIQAEKAALESVLRKDFESIRKLVDKEGTIPFDLSTGLNGADRPKIRLAIARINLQESRRAQIKQQLDYVTQLLGCDIAQKPALYYDFANKLAIGLRVKTEYELSDKNLRLAYVCAQIEASKGMKFRKDQIEKILEVNAQRNEKGEINTVSDLPPAAGKSTFVLPAEMAQLADGEQLVMPMIPTTLAGDGMRLIDVQSQQAFNRLTYKLIFERERKLDIATLKDLLAIMNGAKNNHEFIQMTKEDALTLRSIFFEKCDEYEKSPSKDRKRALILLHRILSVPYHNGVCLPDETHETYAHKKQLNFPLGKEVTLNVDYCLTIETVMKQAVACEELQKAFFENETCFFDTKKYDEVYKPKIAAKIADSKLIKIKGEARKKEFIAFVCDELDYVPAWMEKHKDQFEKISIVKGVLSDLLPRCFKNRAGVNYGRKQSDKTEFARPSDGNNGASVTDCLKNPFEAYVKTIMLIFAEGLSVAQTRKLLLKLKASALAEIEKTGLPYEKTAVGHRFGAILTKEMLNGINDFAVHQVHRKYKRDPNLCLLYTRKVIRPQIKYWKENIENNSQDFGSMFKSSISCTGTPYNDGTYPAWMTMLRDSKTIGQLLDIVTRKLKGISILEKSKPMEVLDEMITTYFGVGSKFSALIDGGALFTGLSNETVAEKLFEHCKKNRPDITAVKFYKEDNNGVEQLYCFTRNHRGPVLVSSVNIPLDECITYYDQRHGFGADIKQAGDGLETMGPNHPLFKWLQELFRIRELKNDTMLETWRNDLLKEQKIQIVMTKDVQKMILESSGNVSNHVPTLKEILQYTVKNEAAIAEEENYSSMLGKIHTVPVKATYGKILDTPSEKFEDWFRVFKDHRDLFITQVQDDPTVLFGRVKKSTPVQDALKSAKKQSNHIVTNSPHFTAEESKAIKAELRDLKQPTLPSNVSVSLDSSGELDDKSMRSSCFGETMQFATKNEQRDEVDEEQNQQQELNQDQNVSQTAPHRGDFNYKPAPFAKDFNPNRYQDFKFEASAEVRRTLLLRTKATCPLFKVRSLLKAASNVLLNKCASDFDPRLWMTNNMVPRHVVNLETAIDIGSHHQLALKECLVHFKVVNGEVKILSMGAVSLDDAAAIRLKLKDQGDVKTVLWHHGLIMAGDSSYQQMLEESEDFQTLMTQLKILDGQTSFKKEEAALIKWLRNSNVSAIADLVDHITVEKDVRLSETHLDGILNLENPDHLLVDDL